MRVGRRRNAMLLYINVGAALFIRYEYVHIVTARNSHCRNHIIKHLCTKDENICQCSNRKTQ